MAAQNGEKATLWPLSANRAPQDNLEGENSNKESGTEKQLRFWTPVHVFVSCERAGVANPPISL